MARAPTANRAKGAIWIDAPEGWQAVQLEQRSGFAIEAILDVDGRPLILARREADGAVRAWSSADGMSWSQVPVEGAMDGYIVDAAGSSPVVLIVDYGSIWTMDS